LPSGRQARRRVELSAAIRDDEGPLAGALATGCARIISTLGTARWENPSGAPRWSQSHGEKICRPYDVKSWTEHDSGQALDHLGAPRGFSSAAVPRLTRAQPVAQRGRKRLVIAEARTVDRDVELADHLGTQFALEPTECGVPGREVDPLGAVALQVIAASSAEPYSV